MPFLIRFPFAVLRAVIVAVAITFSGWVQAVPPDAGERQALGLPTGALSDGDRQALRTLRLARVAVDVAPGLAVDLIAHQGQGAVARDEIETALRAMADGSAKAQDPVATLPLRRITGAKFVRVDPPEG
ncbi:hypothetical protein [Oceaniglobus indicus]|uniref:hypothetical protein n=1 Tax=Oceaniglobus indicus TaxID=2047749 RepID=UPI000C1A3B40|nr:hypothetical protein [Oceaniglobus indicus]